MEKIKKIDFYKHYKNDDEISTLSGACISILTVILIIYFLKFEITYYFNPPLNYSVNLIQDSLSSNEQTITLNYDILFHKVPCQCNSI